MNRNFNNKISDIKEQDRYRRIDLAMLGKLIEMYPKEAKEKVRKLLAENALREDYQPSRNHKKALL